MKTSEALLLIGLGVMGQASFVAAQPKNDPTYSEHNYKHPNKAQEVKEKKGSKPDVYLEEIKRNSNDGQQKNSLDAAENYKFISAEKARIREFRPCHTTTAKPFYLEAIVTGNCYQRFPNTRKQGPNLLKEKAKMNSVAEANR